MTGGYRLDVEVLGVDAKGLDLQYSFHNSGDRSAYLFNRIFSRIDGSGVFLTDKDSVYTMVESEGVTVSKKIFPVPRDIDVEKLTVPAATRVAPGETAHEALHLELPLIPDTPYLRQRPDLGAAPRTLPLFFELGFYLVPPEGERLAHVVTTKQGPAYSFDTAHAERQTVLRVGPLISLPVRPLR
jgi:hypothetical protein